MIPRSVDLIFSTIEHLKTRGWEYTLEASFVEIYNESVRDLITGNDCQCHFDGKTCRLVGSETHQVTSSEAVHRLLAQANEHRAIGETKINNRSSRSHSVFILKINGRCNNETVSGVLSLVDLAGSERVEKSQVSGERLRETQNINKSLSYLGTF